MLCVKAMRDMTAKLQDEYKNNAMHVNPKHKWCMEEYIGQKLKNGKFLIVISIDRKTDSIDRKSGKIRFLKNRAF